MSIFFTRENQTLYPATWEYNALLIIDELATIIKNNGGRIKSGYRAGYIQNRSIDNAIIEYQARAEKIAAAIDEYPDSDNNEKRRAALANLNTDIEKLKQIDNAPRRIEHGLYLSFVIDNSYYYMQLDDNPFFEFYYQKTPIKNGRYSADVYLTELEKTWLYDCFFKMDCAADIFGVGPETITENNAVKIYDILQSFYNSRIVTERETIAAILTELTPLKWRADTIRGYCQSEWNYIVYPDTYSSSAILDFETFYFGKYQDYIVKYRGETVSDFIPDYIAWNDDELNARILELTRDYLTSDENISAADIVYNFDV